MQNSQELPLPFCSLFVKTQAGIDGLDQINEKNLDVASPEVVWNALIVFCDSWSFKKHSRLQGLVLKYSVIILLGL